MPNDSQLSFDEVALALRELPGKLKNAENDISQAQGSIEALRSSLEIARANASMGAETSARSAPEREQQRRATVSKDVEVQRLTQEIFQSQVALAGAESEAKSLSRQFAANCHLATLLAARLNLMASQHQHNLQEE